MLKKILFANLLLWSPLSLAQNANYLPCLKDGTCEAGYLSSSQNSKNELSYRFFSSQDGNPRASLILCLQGGPGCSSTLGLCIENGPLALSQDKNGSYSVNRCPIHWNPKAPILFLDLPAGTGDSLANDDNKVRTDAQAAQEVLFALLQFFAKHPELRKNSLIIDGESYGHWVPSVAQAILNYNRQAKAPLLLRCISLNDPLSGGFVAWTLKPWDMAYHNPFDVGQMVPQDQPKPVLQMIYAFIKWAGLSR